MAKVPRRICPVATYSRKGALARVLAMRQALDIIALKIARGPARTYTGAEIIRSLKTVTR